MQENFFWINYRQLLEFSLLGNRVSAYLFALGLFLVTWLVSRIFTRHFLARLQKILHQTDDLNDSLLKMVIDIPEYFYFLIALYLGLKSLTFGITVDRIIDGIFVVVIALHIVLFLQRFITYAVKKFWGQGFPSTKENLTAIRGINILIGIILWSAGILLVLSNLGFNITTLIASLGIGGVAIAFALQNILGDLFSSFAIYFDRPFEIDDFIIVGENKGTVKQIGLKTTRIQALQGEEIVISNRELTNARIQNFKKMQKRRVAFTLGVTYATPTTKLKKIPVLVRKIIDQASLAELDRVHFSSFGNSSLIFEIVYYCHSNDYGKYMDTQQEINLALKQAFEKERIEFAFPSQTIYLQK